MTRWRTVVASGLVFGCAFLLYRATLLPGGDLGDTASFQAIAGSRFITPRQGYPLYFGLTNLLVWTLRGEPAYVMNLASALAAALAVGVLVWVTEALTGSLLAAVVAALLFASSYTFWSQAIIAEVYALHILMMALSLAALVWWARGPRLFRLALFFGIYAFGFSNHLMMILLLPSCALYMWLSMPRGVRGLVEPRVLVLAVTMAALGALPYIWNFSYLWSLPSSAFSSMERLEAFWFDVTKTDWRQSMVFGTAFSSLDDRAAMYVFDLRQQFGLVGIALASLGAIWLLATRQKTAALVLTLYAVTTVFAFTYNVGDPHVFFLPSHVSVGLLAGAGVCMLQQIASLMVSGFGRTPIRETAGSSQARKGGRYENLVRIAIAVAVLAYPASRILDTYPAVDRSRDRRALQFFETLTRPLDGATTILAVDLNWQLENGLAYYARHVRPAVTWFHARDTLLYFPKLVEWNREIDREIAVTADARTALGRLYGPLLDFAPDTRAASPRLVDQVERLRPGTLYALALLSPDPDLPFDRVELSHTLLHLTGRSIEWDPRQPYHVVIGATGEPPALLRSAWRPFRATARVGALSLEVRMESWLPAETFRRAGFGHIITGRRHALTLERGVSFGTFDALGDPDVTAYEFGIYAPQGRYIVRSNEASLEAATPQRRPPQSFVTSKPAPHGAAAPKPGLHNALTRSDAFRRASTADGRVLW